MKNTFKKIIALIYIIPFYFLETFAGDANNIKDSILPIIKDTPIDSSEHDIDSSTTLLDNLLKYISESIFNLIAIIAIGVFIYIGAKLVTARGNPEEFKKAIMSFIYAVAGIFIVSASWGVVKLVSTINL